MRGRTTGQWELLEEKRSILFLVAGVVLIVYVALLGYQAFIDSSMNFHDNEAAVVGPAGFLLGALGLLGFYPTLAGRSPKLAGAGAVFAVLGILGWFVITATGLANLMGVSSPEWLQVLGLGAFLEMLVGFPLVGIASLRTDIYSQILSSLLLAPAIIFAAMIVSGALTGGSGPGAVLVSSGLTLVHLGIGYHLRTWESATIRGEAPSDMTVE